MERIFIVHRWSSSPKEDWYPWLKSELESKGLEVHVLAMPNTDTPTIEGWIPFLEKEIGKIDEETYFVGHSIGCQTILRYLESLPEGTRVGGAVFVAPWIALTGLETEEEKSIAQPWIETKIDLENVKTKLKKAIAIFSDNDPYVPMINMRLFREKLGAEILLEGHKGHFTSQDNVAQLPAALESLQSMMQ